MMAPKAPYLPSGTVLHTSRGRSPQPVREASAGPGQNPWRPGPKARRRHQPSRPSGRVNLREYWKAPPKSRSRSRPRHRRLNPHAPKGRVQERPFLQIHLVGEHCVNGGYGIFPGGDGVLHFMFVEFIINVFHIDFHINNGSVNAGDGALGGHDGVA